MAGDGFLDDGWTPRVVNPFSTWRSRPFGRLYPAAAPDRPSWGESLSPAKPKPRQQPQQKRPKRGVPEERPAKAPKARAGKAPVDKGKCPKCGDSVFSNQSRMVREGRYYHYLCVESESLAKLKPSTLQRLQKEEARRKETEAKKERGAASEQAQQRRGEAGKRRRLAPAGAGAGARTTAVPAPPLIDLHAQAKFQAATPRGFVGASGATDATDAEKYKRNEREGWKCAQGPFPLGYTAPVPPDVGNEYIAKGLEEVLQLYNPNHGKSAQFKIINLKGAIGQLRKYDKPLETESDVDAFIQGARKCGSSTKDKILELMEKGRCSRADALDCPEERARQLFVTVWGVGDSTARKFVEDGLLTLEDLRTKGKLSDVQRIGLEFYDDINRKIPRAEVTKIAEAFRVVANEVYPGIECTPTGSYRRGKLQSGDVDIMVTHRDFGSAELNSEPEALIKDAFTNLVEKLTERGLLTRHLSASYNVAGAIDFGHFGEKSVGETSHSKYMGLCRLPGYPHHRRLDFIVVPWHDRGAALLYFTGSAYINRSMRALAIKRGMSLSQHGLRKDVVRKRVNGERVKTHEGVLIEGLHTEEDFFRYLGIRWLEPEDRNL